MQVEGKLSWKTIAANLEAALKMRKKIGHLWGNILTMKNILECHFRGEYKVSNLVLLTFSGAIVYLINPIDLIPDTIPVVGFTDDAAVIIGALKQFGDVVAHFNLWKESKARQTKTESNKQYKAQTLNNQQKKVDLASAQQQTDEFYNQEEEKLTDQLLLQIRRLKNYYDQQLALVKQNRGNLSFEQAYQKGRNELQGLANTNKLLERRLLEQARKNLTLEEDRNFLMSKCLQMSEDEKQKKQAMQAMSRQMIYKEKKMQKERLYFCIAIAAIAVIVIII